MFIIALYVNNNEMLVTNMIEEVYLIKSIWFGSIWVGGKEGLGVPLDVSYDDKYIANEAIVPKLRFTGFLQKRWKSLFE